MGLGYSAHQPARSARDSRGAKASCAIVMVHPVRCSNNSVVYTKPVGVEIVVQLLFVVVD
jgi:hypothetical protein